MMFIKQSQNVGDNSVGVQVGRDLIVQVENKIIVPKQANTNKEFKDGSWTYLPYIEDNYSKYKETILSLISLGEYEHANELYWKILFYSGYKGLWNDRVELSKRLYRLSIEKKDFKNSGLILNRGITYSFHETGKHSETIKLIKQSYNYFEQIKYKNGMASCLSRFGEMLVAHKQYKKAESYFQKAIELSSHNPIDQNQIVLKKDFFLSAYYNSEKNKNIDALLKLKKSFFEIKDYREGNIDLEVGKIFFQSGDINNAIYHLKKSANFFLHTVDMPRHYKQAETFLAKCLKKDY